MNPGISSSMVQSAPPYSCYISPNSIFGQSQLNHMKMPVSYPQPNQQPNQNLSYSKNQIGSQPESPLTSLIQDNSTSDSNIMWNSYSSSTNPNSKKSKIRQFTIKIKFTPEEDALLLSLVKEHGSKDWIKISQLMNGKRNPRQCRERYKNYINPDLRKDNWTKEEDELLIQKYAEFGGKWNKIAKYFVNRSDNHLRNRWMMIARHQAKGDTNFLDRSGSTLEIASNPVDVATSSESSSNLDDSSEDDAKVDSQLVQFPDQPKPNPILDSGVEELSSAKYWLDESDFNLLDLKDYGFELFGHYQSDPWPNTF